VVSSSTRIASNRARFTRQDLAQPGSGSCLLSPLPALCLVNGAQGFKHRKITHSAGLCYATSLLWLPRGSLFLAMATAMASFLGSEQEGQRPQILSSGRPKLWANDLRMAIVTSSLQETKNWSKLF